MPHFPVGEQSNGMKNDSDPLYSPLGTYGVRVNADSRLPDVIEKPVNLLRKSRQVSPDGFPDNLQIDTEITMRHAIAHGVNQRPWDISVLGGESR